MKRDHRYIRSSSPTLMNTKKKKKKNSHSHLAEILILQTSHSYKTYKKNTTLQVSIAETQQEI